MRVTKWISIIVVNVIVWGFADGGKSISSRQVDVMLILMASIIPANLEIRLEKEEESKITFSNKDDIGILPRYNDIMVITIEYENWDIKWVMIDPRSLTYILFLSAFKGLKLNPYDIWTFHLSLVGILHEHVRVKGHITLELKYLVVDALSPYNATLGRPTFNLLGMLLSTFR